MEKNIYCKIIFSGLIFIIFVPTCNRKKCIEYFFQREKNIACNKGSSETSVKENIQSLNINVS